MFLSRSACPWRMKCALYDSLDVPSILKSTTNLPLITFARRFISYLCNISNAFLLKSPFNYSSSALLQSLLRFLRASAVKYLVVSTPAEQPVQNIGSEFNEEITSRSSLSNIAGSTLITFNRTTRSPVLIGTSFLCTTRARFHCFHFFSFSL